MFTSTNISKKEITLILEKLNTPTPVLSKTMYGAVEASNLVLESVISVALPTNTIVSLDSMIEELTAKVKQSGNYTKEHISDILKQVWESVNPLLNVTSTYRKVIKEWIKNIYKYVQLHNHHKLKELELEANILAIKVLMPLL